MRNNTDWGVFFIIFIGILFYSCSNKDYTIHPVNEKLPNIKDQNNILDISLEAKKTSNEYLSLKTYKTSKIINVQDKIIDDNIVLNVDLDKYGNSYFVSPNLSEILVFDNKGLFSYSIGRSGRGPTDFEMISDIAVSGDSLFVLDNLNIDLYVSEENKFKYETSIPHQLDFKNDICVIDSSIFVSGSRINSEDFRLIENSNLEENESIKQENYNSALPIHEFNIRTKTFVKSFGYPYTSVSNWPPFSSMLSKSKIVCSNIQKSIISINVNFGIISAFDIKGNLFWRSKINNYRHIYFKEIKEPVPTLSIYNSESNYTSYIHSFILLDKNYTLLQIGISLSNINSYTFDNLKSILKNKNNKLKNIIINNKYGKIRLINIEKNIIEINNNYILVKNNEYINNNTKYYLYEK